MTKKTTSKNPRACAIGQDMAFGPSGCAQCGQPRSTHANPVPPNSPIEGVLVAESDGGAAHPTSPPTGAPDGTRTGEDGSVQA